ncbi:MAG TPA: hypothetical protein VHU79_09515 [Sphingomicrobium sp.]|nr:hypothetical protein [Sphingomicrobium sp.]
MAVTSHKVMAQAPWHAPAFIRLGYVAFEHPGLHPIALAAASRGLAIAPAARRGR